MVNIFSFAGLSSLLQLFTSSCNVKRAKQVSEAVFQECGKASQKISMFLSDIVLPSPILTKRKAESKQHSPSILLHTAKIKYSGWFKKGILI